MIHEKKQNHDHRIALKKRLAKAKKRMGIQENSDDSKMVAKPRVNQKPDPVKPLLHAARRHQETIEEKRLQTEQAKKQRETMLKASQQRREANKQVHKARTSRGQPKLSAQIGLLLDKLTNNK